VSSFNIHEEPKHSGDWKGDPNSTLIVDKDNYVILCSGDTLLVYTSNGKYIKSVKLLGRLYMISGIDSKGNVILCDLDKGKMYSIDNILQLEPNAMEHYLVWEKIKKACDMTIDCDGNLWILHGIEPYYLSKYVPLGLFTLGKHEASIGINN
jgi:hypothetical protein